MRFVALVATVPNLQSNLGTFLWFPASRSGDSHDCFEQGATDPRTQTFDGDLLYFLLGKCRWYKALELLVAMFLELCEMAGIFPFSQGIDMCVAKEFFLSCLLYSKPKWVLGLWLWQSLLLKIYYDQGALVHPVRQAFQVFWKWQQICESDWYLVVDLIPASVLGDGEAQSCSFFEVQQARLDPSASQTGFKTCEDFGTLLQLGLLVCCCDWGSWHFPALLFLQCSVPPVEVATCFAFFSRLLFWDSSE